MGSVSSWKKIGEVYLTFVLLTLAAMAAADANASGPAPDQRRFIQVEARTRDQRTAVFNAGVSIEAIRSDSVWGIANAKAIERLQRSGQKILGDFPLETARGGHENLFGFPVADDAFHTYDETLASLRDLASRHADLARVVSIGKSHQGRDLWALHLNSTPEALLSGKSSKPGAVYLGNHHAREHLSAEVPLLFAKHLLDNRQDPRIAALLDTRDIWILPMINPDGAEYDIATGRYQYWRKNRRDNGDGTFGVDLNRNYGWGWGTGGSDKDTDSDVYMGPAPFSEPESRAVKALIESLPNAKVLLSFHTFSELILYPWGGSANEISNSQDLAIYKKMAQTMAGWNKYTAQQSSDLYIASGDTTDWTYGEHGILSFTFELSPKGWGYGGFYPGAKIIDRVFQENLKPCLYLLDVAADPTRVLDGKPSGWLENYVEPRIPSSLHWQANPL